MKNKILIIEDDFCKFFTTKQILESQLKLDVKIVGIENFQEMIDHTIGYKPNTLLFQPCGGVGALLSKLQKKKVNRINSEVTLMIVADIKPDFLKNMHEKYTEYYGKRLNESKLLAA